MKYLITIALISFSFFSVAQLKETVLKSIHDDGKTMPVKITVALHDVSVNYDKKFDITGMTADAKKAMVNRIIASLGVANYFKEEMKTTKTTPSEHL